MSRDTVNRAAEIKLLADRKAGELLKQLQRGHGPGRGKTCDSMSRLSDYRAVLKDTETSARTAERWQKIAEIPEDRVRDYLSAVHSSSTWADLTP